MYVLSMDRVHPGIQSMCIHAHIVLYVHFHLLVIIISLVLLLRSASVPYLQLQLLLTLFSLCTAHTYIPLNTIIYCMHSLCTAHTYIPLNTIIYCNNYIVTLVPRLSPLAMIVLLKDTVECRGFESHLRQLIFLRKSDYLGCAVLL